MKKRNVFILTVMVIIVVMMFFTNPAGAVAMTGARLAGSYENYMKIVVITGFSAMLGSIAAVLTQKH